MKAIEAMKKYRIPTTTTPEELESSWSKLLTFGDKVVTTTARTALATLGPPTSSPPPTTPAKGKSS